MSLPTDADRSWVLHLDLPPGPHTCADLHPVVYGVRLDHGAKPWPWFRDGRGWWSLSTPSDTVLQEALWLVDLEQLGYHPVETRRPFLEEVLGELRARAARLGATVRPVGSVDDALRRVAAVQARAELEHAVLQVLVTRADQAPVPNIDWMRALEGAGFRHGDGDMYWLDHEATEIGAEPYSDDAWFHPAGPPLRNVQLYVPVRDVRDLEGTAERLAALAEAVAAPLGMVAVTLEGRAFHAGLAAAAARKVREALG